MIQAVDRAFRILWLLSTERRPLGITEIANALGLNKGTAFGLVKTLAHEGLLERDPQSRKYNLGLRLTELGMIQTWGMPIYQAGVYPVRRLSVTADRSARLYAWDRTTVLLILNMVHPTQDFPFTGLVRPRIPAYCTGAGKAILSRLSKDHLAAYFAETELVAHTPNTLTTRSALESELDEARRTGVAYDREEFVQGFSCVSAPILDRWAHPCGAVSISVEADLFRKESSPAIASEVQRTAMEISHAIGHQSMHER